MRPSRGMGAIAPSKMPRARTVKKRDGDEPVKVFKKGGKVRRFNEGGESGDMSQDVEKRQKSKREGFRFDAKGRDNPSGFRFEGGGGKDEYATSAGGRLSYDIPVGKNATLSPHIQGFVAKPSTTEDRKIMGRFTGAGVTYNKQFKAKGGAITKSKVNQAGNYTKPGMRESLFKSIKARAVQGTGAGQWSARKAQLLAKQYKAKGGGYKG